MKIQQVRLYFARGGGSTEMNHVQLLFTEDGSGVAVGGEANSIDGLISTASGSAASWTTMIGKRPTGEWRLTLPVESTSYFNNGEIEDILLVLTFGGRVPEWPA